VWDTNSAANDTSNPQLAVAVACSVVISAVASVDLKLSIVLTLALLLVPCLMMARRARCLPGTKQLAVVTLVAVNFLNLSDSLIKFAGLPSINKVLVPGLALYCLYRYLTRQEVGRGLICAVSISVVIYVAAAMSILGAHYPEAVSTGLKLLRKDLLMMIVLVALITRKEDLVLACYAIVYSAAFLSLIGIYSYFSGDPGQVFIGLSRWVYHLDGNGISDLRIAGPVGDPNFFAQSLVLAFPISIYLVNSAYVAMRYELSQQRIALTCFCIINMVLIVVCIVMTQSRGGLLALIIVALVSGVGYLTSLNARLLSMALVGLTVAIFLIAAPGQLTTRISDGIESVRAITQGESIQDEAVLGRYHEMLVAGAMAYENPLFGVGYNSYSNRYQDYAIKQGLSVRGKDRDAHSLLLEIAAEQGLFGVVVFSAIVFMLLKRCVLLIRLSQAVRDFDIQILVKAIALGLLAYLTAGILLHDAFQRYLWLYLGLVVAATQIAYQLTPAAQVGPHKSSRAS